MTVQVLQPDDSLAPVSHTFYSTQWGPMLILPPLLKRRFAAAAANTVGIFWHYRNMTPYPRLIARYTLGVDSLIGELATLVPQKTDMANILDVGCGYGVPACWMADRYPDATIHGIDPQPERVRIAALALGDRGCCVRGSAPDLPTMDVLLNLATMLDVSHFLQDWELEKTLERPSDHAVAAAPVGQTPLDKAAGTFGVQDKWTPGVLPQPDGDLHHP